MESGGPGGDDAPQPHHGGAPPEGAGGGGEGRVHQTGWGLAAVQHNTYALCDQESSIFVLCILIKYIYIYILKSSIFVLCILITIYSYIYIYAKYFLNSLPQFSKLLFSYRRVSNFLVLISIA